jgi:hypothetical protein
LAAQIPAVEAVYETAVADRRWIEGHDVFDTVRRLSLAHERSGGAPRLTGLVLDVAETVAKITYNASGASAPFDYHAGWHLAPRVHAFAAEIGDAGFTERLWHPWRRAGRGQAA